MGAQLSAAKSKLEEHLMRIAQEEPSSPEPEQASTFKDVFLFRCQPYVQLCFGLQLQAGRDDFRHQSAFTGSCLQLTI